MASETSVPEIDAEDVIIIKKSWLRTAAVAVVFFVAGGLAGYFFGVFAYERGADAAGTVAQAAPNTQAAAPAQPTRLEEVNLDDDPSIGRANAPIVVVEFSDFECPYCGRYHTDTHRQLFEQYGDDMLFVYRDFPLSSIHPRAQQSAEAAECAHEQGSFWEYHDLLFSNQTALDTESLIGYAGQLDLDVDDFRDCVETGRYTEEVLADFNEGRSYGVSGTPTFFINGVPLVGAQPFASFQQIMDEELAS